MVRMEKTLAAYGIKPKKEKFVRKFRFTVDKDELNKYRYFPISLLGHTAV